MPHVFSPGGSATVECPDREATLYLRYTEWALRQTPAVQALAGGAIFATVMASLLWVSNGFWFAVGAWVWCFVAVNVISFIREARRPRKPAEDEAPS